MSIKKEIQYAIAMHSVWKSRLDKCIETGIFDTPADVVEMDNKCYFGKWLYGKTIRPAIRDSEEYKKVKECHARFHHAAAKVIKLSLSGNKKEAADLMSSSGEYTIISTELIREMISWANNVE